MMGRKSWYKNIFTYINRILIWILVSFAVLLAIIDAILLIPAVQNKIADIAVARIDKKIENKVELEKLQLTLPNMFVIKNLFIEDQIPGDTLLNIEKLKLNVDMLKLLKNELSINRVELAGAQGKLWRASNDTVLNLEQVISQLSGSNNQTKKQQSQEQQKEPLKLSFGHVTLTDIHFQYLDSLNQLYLTTGIGDFYSNINTLDVQNLHFDIKKLDLQDSHTSLELSSANKSRKTKESKNVTINLENKLNLENVSYSMKNNVSESSMEVLTGLLQLESVTFNLDEEQVTYDNIKINESKFANIQNTSTNSVKTRTDKNPQTSNNWEVSGGSIELTDNNIVLSSKKPGITSNKFNPQDLHIQLDKAFLDNILYSPSEIKAEIHSLSATEGRQFHIEEFQGNIIFNSNKLHVSDVVFRTKKSSVYPDISIQYPSQEEFLNLSGNIALNVALQPSIIHIDDISYFIKTSNKQLTDSLPFHHIELALQSSGNLPNVEIQSLSLNTGNGTKLKMHGHLHDALNLKTAVIDLEIDTIHTMFEDYGQFVSSVENNGLQWPENIQGRGSIQGSMTNASANMAFETENNSFLRFQSSYNQDTVNNIHLFDGTLNIPTLHLGHFMNDTAKYNLLSMNATFEANVSENKSVEAYANINIPSVDYLQYNYNNLLVEATYKNDSARAHVSVDDEFLSLKGNLGGGFNDSLPLFSADLVFDKVNAQKLNFTDHNILGKGKISFNMQGSNLDNLNGNLNISEVLILKNQQQFTVDSFLVMAVNNGDYTHFNIASSLMMLDYEGSVKMSELPKTLATHVNQYFQLPVTQDSIHIVNGKYFDLTTEIYDADIFTQVLVPGLRSFQPGNMEVHYNSSAHKLNADINFPKILFYNLRVDSLRLSLQSDAQALTYHTILKKAGTEQFWLENYNVYGNVTNDKISNVFRMTSNDSVKYLVKSTLESTPDALIGRLGHDSLILDFEPWTVPENNKVVVSNGGYNFSNFTITRDGQKASVFSRVKNDVKKTSLSFNDFNVKSITNVITANKPILKGLLFGETTVWFDPGLAFTSDLDVRDLTFFEEPIGNLSMLATNMEAQKFNVDVSLSGRNDLTVKGFYESGTSSEFDIQTELKNIKLETLQPFLSSNLNKLKGTLHGRLSLSGQIEDPAVAGTINLESVEVIPTYLNTLLTISNGSISIKDELVTIQTFQLRDANDNRATLSGSVNFEQLTNPKLDVAFNSNDFLLLNTQNAPGNETYYGRVVANLGVEANGYALSPQLDVNVEVLDGTDFTYVVKPQSPATIEKSGLVEFAGNDTVSFGFGELQNRQDTIERNTLQGIGLQANIELNPEAIIHIQLDPISEEQMTLNGTANLSLKKNINGELSLVGRYEIVQGTYELKLYEFLRREFKIQEGSYIVWGGDILNPQADLTAVYVVETSPSQLLAGSTQETALVTESPFYVNLNISDDLLSPSFSFELEAPPRFQGSEVAAVIQNINQDESRLNQQVFSLLLFQQFMSDELFGSRDFNQQITTTAQEGLNNLLSDQLTRFAETYIQGFDIDLDIDSYNHLQETDNSLFSNTQVQLNVSKTLFDERLTVSVGSNVTLAESPEQQIPGNQSGLIGDIAVEYKLTPSGKWKLKGFNKTEFEDVIDGEVTKTGVSIIFSKNFYQFSDLFRKDENRKLTEVKDE